MLLATAVVCGCTGGKAHPYYTASTGGSAERGRAVIRKFKCGSCHNIPGIEGANGVFGPPLNFIARRTIIGGNFNNTTENLVHWIQSPPSMKPQTDMPELGLSEQEARDAAAYLETLRELH